MTELEGLSCVVTGASGGIGRAAAVLFAENGANVLCVDIGDVEGTLSEINGLDEGGKAVGMRADVGDEVSGWPAGSNVIVALFSAYLPVVDRRVGANERWSVTSSFAPLSPH